MNQPALTLAPELEGRLRLGLVAAGSVRVAPSSPGLLEEIAKLAERQKRACEGLGPAQIPELAPARELYKAFGVDPTKTRPSSESLLRRVLRDKPLPRISNAVDVCNQLALDFLLPLGLYDTAKIRGPVRLRPGRPDESYAGIRKNEVHLDGRPVLADDTGPFGNPTSDSLRTSVDESTRSLWMVIFAPSSVPEPAMAAYVETACSSMRRHLLEPGGTCTGLVRS